MGFFSAKFENEYTLGRRIGNGVKSQIRECRGVKDHKEYVVKIYPSDLAEANSIRYEHHLFAKNKINSVPNILKLKDCFFDKYHVYYVMERYESVLDGHKYSEYDLSSYFKQLFTALSALHSMNIVHRNISGKNLVFANKDNNVLLLKGLRYMLSTKEYSKFNVVVEHSLQYLSPEIISQDTNLLNIPKSDVWACGVILYTLLFGNNLFPLEFPFDNYSRNIVKGNINWSLKSPLLDQSKLAVDFCKGLLKLNPNERVTAAQALAHPWLSVSTEHNKVLAPDAFYKQVVNSIDELDTLEENTSIQYRHKLNEEFPSRSFLGHSHPKPASSFTLPSKPTFTPRPKPSDRSQSKCLPFPLPRPSRGFHRFGSKSKDKKPLILNPVVDTYVKGDDQK